MDPTYKEQMLNGTRSTSTGHIKITFKNVFQWDLRAYLKFIFHPETLCGGIQHGTFFNYTETCDVMA